MRFASRIAPLALSMALAHYAGAGAVARPLPEAEGGAGPARPGGEAPASSPRVGPPELAVTIPGAEQFDLRSRSGLEYRIFVAGPSGDVPGPGAPVIYLTDGNRDFPVLLAAAQRQSRGELGVVVVGIGYPGDDREAQLHRRAFDLTPVPTGGPPPEGFPRYPSGGNDRFLEFIEDELKPAIERRYRIDRDRQALFGHSFGGLFVLHALFSRPGSFRAYIASSPSTWWDDGRIHDEARAFAGSRAGERVEARLLITVGEREPAAGPGTPAERVGEPAHGRGAGGAEELAASLAASRVAGLTVSFHEFADEAHGSVVLPAASRGVRFALAEE